jgi:drug/metabolite transporter (DMT)-like permease
MKALILLIVSGILAAGVFITGKQAGSNQLSPLLVLFWQMSGGALVVWLVSWPSRQFPTWDAAHFRYYLFGGLLGISIPYALAFIVMQELQVGIVGLLTALSPVVTYAIARSLRIEEGHPLRLAGLVIGLAGVTLLALPQADVSSPGNGIYMVIAFGIPLSLAASNIYRSRYWPPGSKAMPLVIGMLTVQGAWLLVVNLLFGNFQDGLFVSGDSMWTLAFLGLLAGASYMSSFRLLKVGGPVYLSQMGYVITAVTLVAGILIWNEHYDGQDILSMGLILLGVLVTSLTQRVQHRQAKVQALTK